MTRDPKLWPNPLRLSAISIAALCWAHSADASPVSDLHAVGNDPAADTEADGHADEHDPNHLDEIIVTATRSGRALDREAVRVEVISGEEIQEKALMRPGNISMLVAETGGVRVQTTSPALGAANIRLQGLYGRYTQLLSDGLPLYGGQAASIGLLQIPPTDLSQVEIIKGSASSLYGGSALGGVINLVSRRPSTEASGEVLFNATTENGQDLTTYLETPFGDNFGASLTAGAHRQSTQDFDADGWIDMPGYERFTARPRLVWNGDNGTSVYTTFGVMTENRRGGTLDGETVPDGTPFQQNLNTTRVDGGIIADIPLDDSLSLSLRGSAMQQDHEHRFGEVLEDDRHESYFAEAALSGGTDRTDWTAGVAFQSDTFRSDTFPVFDYTYDVPGLFAQIDHDLDDQFNVSVSARVDDHSEYGTKFSPRVSALYTPGDWTIRASYGRGFFAPTPFVEDIEAAGLSRLAPLEGLEEERAETASFDVGYPLALPIGDLEANVSLFASNVDGVTETQAFASTQGGGARPRAFDERKWRNLHPWFGAVTALPLGRLQDRGKLSLSRRHGSGPVGRAAPN